MEGYMLDAEYKEQWYESWRGILMEYGYPSVPEIR